MAKMRGRKGCSKAFVAIISRGRDIKMMNEVMALSTSKVLSKGLQVVVWRSVYLMLLSHCLVYNHPPTEVCTTSGESVVKIIILLDIRQYCAIYLYNKGPLLLLH